MTQSSARAQAIANILYELKRSDKLATHTAIADRAGFSAGVKGRSVVTSLKTVRRDWPHLQWWRAVADNGQLEKGSDQERLLVASGFEIETVEGDVVVIQSLESRLMNWHDGEMSEPMAAQEAAK